MTTETIRSTKYPAQAHAYAAWPLILIIIGGAIGLVYAVIAYLINLKIYASDLSRMNKILANLLCGMAACSGWWFSAQWIQSYLSH